MAESGSPVMAAASAWAPPGSWVGAHISHDVAVTLAVQLGGSIVVCGKYGKI
jgi:hypothetical protein